MDVAARTAPAHAELGAALPVLASRFGPPVIAGEVTWRPAFGIHGPNELPLRFAEPAGPVVVSGPAGIGKPNLGI